MLFSTGAVAVKASTLTGWQVAGFRSALAAITLFVFLPGVRKAFSWRALIVAAAYVPALTLYVLSSKMTTAANVIFLQSAAPLYLLLLGPWLLKEPVTRKDSWFIASLIAGMCLLFFAANAGSTTAPRPLLGNILAACGGVAWGLSLLGLRWLARDGGGSQNEALFAVVAGNVLVFGVCSVNAFPVVSSTPVDWLIMIYLGLFQITLAYVFVTAGMRRISALEASLVLLLEPVLTPVWAWWLLAEKPGSLALIGGTVIIGATAARAWQASR